VAVAEEVHFIGLLLLIITLLSILKKLALEAVIPRKLILRLIRKEKVELSENNLPGLYSCGISPMMFLRIY
jgi:hypothetical protein